MLGLWSYFWDWVSAFTGVVDCDQAAQNSSAVGEVPAGLGGGYWAHFGQRHWSAPRYKPAPSVPIPVPEFAPFVVISSQISGQVATEQPSGSSEAQAELAFGGIVVSRQKRQVVSAKGSLAFGGFVGSHQIAITSGDAEMVDVELELFAALAMVA